MTFFQPAVRARQAKRHPALDVGHGPHTVVSPGARRDHYDYLYYHQSNNHGLNVLTTGTPDPTTVVTDAQASAIGDPPSPTTVAGALTSTVTPIIPGGLSFSGSVPSSTLPAVTGSSDTTPSSSSSPPPASTPTPTPETSSPVPQSPVSGSTTPTSDGATSADSFLGGAAKSSSHLSGGGIAAIVIVLVLALCGVTFFVLRRRQIQRRVARRVTWTTNLAPQPNLDSLEKGSSDAPVEVASQSSSKEGEKGHEKALAPVRNIARKPPLPYSPVSPTAPPQTRSNSPDAGAPSVHSAGVSTPTQDMSALVRMTFVPQLPDELAIKPGETLYIQMEYDDGWALCVNASGKEGMVPLECLEGVDGHAGLSRLRTMRRASSLRSAASWS